MIVDHLFCRGIVAQHGSAVEIYLIKDNGHAWPGGQRGSRRGDKPSSSLNATDIIYAFFTAHTKLKTGSELFSGIQMCEY